MSKVRCPHCNARKLMRHKIHPDVVAVMSCLGCQELAVMFRGIVIPLDRKIVESGSNVERAKHFAGVIAAFLDAGIMPFQTGGGIAFPGMEESFGVVDESAEARGSITAVEVENFVKVDLKGLDDASYFKKHFG